MSEIVPFLGTGSSFARGFMDTCIANSTDAAFLLMMSQRARNTLIILSKKQSPLPSDVVGTSTAIALAGANGTSGSI